jgi:penicillin-binding protein 1A
MRKVTGGGPPAEIWRLFMGAALPRLKAQPIPGGVIEPPGPAAPDAIGDMLGTIGIGPAAEQPAPTEPEKPLETELPY